MYDRFSISSPRHTGFTAHLPENNIDVLNSWVSGTLEHAIGDTPPRVIGRELDLDAVLTKHNVRKGVRMWVGVDLNMIGRNE